MPTKKKSQRKQFPAQLQQQETSKAKATNTKAHCTKKLKASEKGVDNGSLITTLKENNKSLAAALDEARKKCGQLQLECLQYQKERQELLETVAVLRATMMEGVKEEITAQIRIHMGGFKDEIMSQIRMHILEQIQWDLNMIKQLHLSLHSTNAPAPGPPLMTGSHSNALSPIAEPDTQVHFAPFISVAAVSHDDDKTAYPRTPYPSASFKHPQYSSTPNSEKRSSTFSYPCFAIDFGEECVSTPVDTNTAQECVESVVNDDYGAEAHVLEGGSETSPDLPTHKERNVEPSVHNEKKSSVLQTHGQRNAPLLQAPEKDYDSSSLKDNTLDELKDHLTKVQTSNRPRRKCATFSTSYQEPQIRSKLRQGDRFTDTSMIYPSTKPRSKKSGTTTNRKSKPRVTLQDITNKK